MQTIVRRLGAVAVLIVLAGPAPAGAASSVSSGWWTSAPVAVAPDVSADQLLVQGGPDSALAYAGVSFALTKGERPTQVVLHVAPSSATTPSSRLALCPLRSSAPAASGGPSAEGPAFDCAIKVEAAVASDGTSYSFDVSSLPSAGSLDIAVLPTAQTDRVVLARPGTDALQSQTGAATAATKAGSTLPSVPTAFDPLRDGFAPVFGGAAAADDTVETAAPAAPAAQTAGPAVSLGSPLPVPGGNGSSRWAALLFTLLAAAAIGLWAFAGRRSSPSVAG
jgi:hypothetical protein